VHTADEPGWYEIRFQGHLDDRWASWFDGLDLEPDPDGTSVLHGRVVDQAALHGVLARLRDLGLPLLSVSRDAGDSDPDLHADPAYRPIDPSGTSA
jgi:hypothetical protein